MYDQAQPANQMQQATGGAYQATSGTYGGVGTANYPSMPADFCPEGFTVAATYQGAELGFHVSRQEWEDGLADEVFAKRLKALREALWAGAHWSNDHLRVADLRNT